MRLSLLAIDDDEVDRLALQRALRTLAIDADITWVSDVQSGLDSLRGMHGARRLERPLIVLLDLALPGMAGLEFLRRLRADRRLSDTVVFVRSVSSATRDIRDAYRHHVAGYIIKPHTDSDSMQLVDLLQRYWQVVQLPPETPGPERHLALAPHPLEETW